jgi:O-antigen/teichoic acid export membrane protein
MTSSPAAGVRQAPSRQDLGHLSLVTAGKLASIASLVLCNVAVARWTSGTGDFGRYAAGVSLALILDATLGVPLDLAVVRFTEIHPGEAARVERLHAAAFRLKLLLGLVLVTVAASFGSVLSPALLGADAGPSLVTGVALVTVALQLVRSAAVRLQADSRFAGYAALDGLQGITRFVAVAVALACGLRSAEALLVAYAMGTALAIVGGWRLSPIRFLREPWPGRGDLREAALHVALTVGIVVCGTLTGRADIPLVASARSAEDAGMYAVAVQVSMLLTMLASYYSVVMQPRILRLATDGQLAASWRRNAAWALVVSLATAAAAAWALPTLLPGFFGPRYVPAVPIAQVLLVGTCLDLFCMPVSMVFSIQRFPIASLASEAALALAFFGVASTFASMSTLAVASLVTGVRAVKLLVYSAITLAYLWRRQPLHDVA